MPFIDRASRVGRSQGASIFWGLISVCFAGAACFYYGKNRENEISANQMRDQVMQLREENDTLHSERDHLETSRTEAENELKTREDLVNEKETELAQEESQLESLAQQTTVDSEQNLAQVPMMRRFNDVIRKLSQPNPPDVIERNGRPVLRIPASELFAPGDASLKPEGKALLNQITLGVNGLIQNFELRVAVYTDTDVETEAAAAGGSTPKPAYATSWDLTAARTATLGHYYRDQTTLPFQNVMIIGRGDSDPIAPNDGADHARNRRVEITISPLPVPFHAPEAPNTVQPAEVNAKPANSETSSETPAPKKARSKSKPKSTDSTSSATATPASTPSASANTSESETPVHRSSQSGKMGH